MKTRRQETNMLGWSISFYEKPEELVWIQREYSRDLELGDSLGGWWAALPGIKWIDELVEEGKAELLATNGGYPLIYSLDSEALALAYLTSEESVHRDNVNNVFVSKLENFTGPLIVHVWDQS